MSLLGKSFDFGLGLLTLSREKVEAFVDEMVNRGEIEKKEAHQVANDLIKKGEEERDEIRRWIQDEVSKALDNLAITRKEEALTQDQIRQIIREEVEAALKRQSDQEASND